MQIYPLDPQRTYIDTLMYHCQQTNQRCMSTILAWTQNQHRQSVRILKLMDSFNTSLTLKISVTCFFTLYSCTQINVCNNYKSPAHMTFTSALAQLNLILSLHKTCFQQNTMSFGLRPTMQRSNICLQSLSQDLIIDLNPDVDEPHLTQQREININRSTERIVIDPH